MGAFFQFIYPFLGVLYSKFRPFLIQIETQKTQNFEYSKLEISLKPCSSPSPPPFSWSSALNPWPCSVSLPPRLHSYLLTCCSGTPRAGAPSWASCKNACGPCSASACRTGLRHYIGWWTSICPDSKRPTGNSKSAWTGSGPKIAPPVAAEGWP